MLKKVIFVILFLSMFELQATDILSATETTVAAPKPKPTPIIFEDNEGSPCMPLLKKKMSPNIKK